MSDRSSKFGRATIAIVSVFLIAFSTPVFATPRTSEMPPGWVKVTVGTQFEFMAPAGSEYRPGTGNASISGTIVTPDFTLWFNYGRFSNPLNNMRRYADRQSQNIEVDGRSAFIVIGGLPHFATARPNFVGIHFPSVAKNSRGAIKLTVTGRLRSQDNVALALRIFRTIRFR